MGRFKVVEKFISINGEGRCAGELAAFIRFAGCNLNCSYCDTRWANEANVTYEILSEEEIYAYIKNHNVNNVTLTGGEPLLQENIGRLIKLLSKDKSLRIEVETNGAVSLKDYIDIGDNVSFTLDYKLPGSKMNHMMVMDNYDIIRIQDTVKFVVSDQEDLDKAREIIEEYSLTDKVAVYLSSSFGVIKPEDIVNYMIEHNLNKVKLQLQMHKYIWNPNRKGV
ncbi:MAG: putative 7-carboxy-7-deazaguanine synthase QueE [Lachnospiraceae bacterium]|nr:putative 7-carboxy-7-deazaguanine synthase QueE [Lachnospiraceae bacterium]